MNPRLPLGVRLRNDTVRGRWVLLAPERIFEVDDVGVAILECCDGRGLEAMLADLSKTFDAPVEAIKGDVVSFLQGFAEKRVIEL
jgi:pyrroloquinoline quinone biosynthesis protein D